MTTLPRHRLRRDYADQQIFVALITSARVAPHHRLCVGSETPKPYFKCCVDRVKSYYRGDFLNDHLLVVNWVHAQDSLCLWFVDSGKPAYSGAS
ncbi:unnamed protein product [Haemonchus placei]|uniref:Transposase n=1 Tax=Haemonchus placei TaxID=6290 RepID=A0A0N4WJL2_HAEPC|nr:unnamed protein product [Haemonchus placei]